MKPSSIPNKDQKVWREYLREQGCIFGYPGPVEIHHIIGRQGKHNKIAIGHWLIVPVSNQAHREIEAMPKREQVQIFIKECLAPYWYRFGNVPMDEGELLAIVTWER